VKAFVTRIPVNGKTPDSAAAPVDEVDPELKVAEVLDR
jgi:hypothetical protein